MRRSDIPDEHVIELARRWQRNEGPGVVGALVAEGVPEKLALRKVEHLVDRDLLEYGTSPYHAWPTDYRSNQP
ncbi:hypothetical protein IMZ11_02495 [Microtetraspora sp. AC03309]|uniref:hypothetical protein n=1 Tax=Microtetraspora sp. AC03309 TaxID=2779376 RepID=UPI001E4D19BD|nr:hypothetical protein [Microtetraspora sp. AC03309]MCC5574508.1 hypothetical protein [Microtetraspora sp. AC03309]